MPRAKADKPRGRMSSYAYFVQTCREEHRKKHPDEAIAFAAFSKKCSDRWKVSQLSSLNVCVWCVLTGSFYKYSALLALSSAQKSLMELLASQCCVCELSMLA